MAVHRMLLKIIISVLFLEKYFAHETAKPNIILLIADDLGWNDVGFHGSSEIPTPNIDALAYHGAILNRHYTQPVCSPSRAALMTGRYPIRMGFQGGALHNAYPISLPLNETILPQYLKKQGYTTHMVGKWHLGFHQNASTPNRRGFDSFFGFYTGAVRYNDSVAVMGPGPGFDARDNFKPAGERFVGKYNTDVFADEAVRIIRHHDDARPLFLELAFSAVHALFNSSLQVRNVSENEAKFSYIKDPNRRLFAGVLSVLDESVGKITRALDEKGLLQNSVVLFISDNGAESDPGMFQNFGSNWPLRGKKGTVLEGGVRGVAAIWSPLLLRNVVFTNLIHLTDWLPTFYAAAGGGRINGVDGVNQWDYLRGIHSKPPRSQVLVNIDDQTGSAALIKDGWKLIKTKNVSVRYGLYRGMDWSPKYQIDQILASPTHMALSKFDKKPLSENDIFEIRSEANIKNRCQLRLNESHEKINEKKLPCFDSGCLFDLENDPCEFKDMSESHPKKLVELDKILDEFAKQQVKQWSGRADPKAFPQNFGNYWTPWVV